ncbi:MAG: hypothetical protein VZT48_05880 [Bulleidia sp.]|nr:hypothetical protein [Bulleidia sp.]
MKQDRRNKDRRVLVPNNAREKDRLYFEVYVRNNGIMDPDERIRKDVLR